MIFILYLSNKLTPEQLEAIDKENQKEIPHGGKYGDPDEDLGPVMIFLASDSSKFITGQLMAGKLRLDNFLWLPKTKYTNKCKCHIYEQKDNTKAKYYRSSITFL